MNIRKLGTTALLTGLVTASTSLPASSLAFADSTPTTASSSAPMPPNNALTQTPTGTLENVASQIQLTAANVTGQPDSTFAHAEQRYAMPADGLSDPTKWTGYFRQGGRQLVFNLGSWKYISAVSLDFEQNQKAGIFWPTTMKVEVSQDGTNWAYISQNDATTAVTGSVKTLTVIADQPYKSAFLRITFPVAVWAFARNLQVWHDHEMIPVDTSPTFEDNNPTADKGVLNPGKINRIHHMLLVYTGANGADGTWNTSDFEPMLDYYDTHNIAETRMFDTMLFLPYGSVQDSAQGWSNYLNDLFAPNGELANLNAAVQVAGKALYTNYQENVVLTIPYPQTSVSQFGSITPGGPNLDFTNNFHVDSESLANREQAVQWYYQQLMVDWKQSNFSNLNLVGIYWNDEGLNPGTDDATLAQYAHQLIQKDSLPLLWIPYYGAPNVNDWSELGFDAAILQPNYYELPSEDTGRITNAVNEANAYGLGVEMEVDGNALAGGAGAVRYTDELRAAAQLLPPQMNIVSAFYAGSKVLVKAYNSSNADVRALYDATGQWLQNH